ncbi:3-oxoacyl-[acyl-carrier protein] reductase [Neorhizobium sp. R1-B]|uniref:SDR family oxidoreductase n=1 Tax=Neorhizobium TaxID=1525371 RepID=UPI000CF8FED1|nr:MULTISPECIES: SDR family oxidoreductase [Neorhizobium]TCV66810.1 3-oxoacyl-[acyl-carrier protein] reductase [Neorhizobium sp. S3-V5DH]TDX78296.1 3-oxoacyl-[acyl-carrier protein] reductase [Neorhizobium sp. R1-B]
MTIKGQRAAIVTGASKGIGRAIALQLAQDGIAVVVNYSSSHDAAAAVVAEIETSGGKAVAVQADMAGGQAAANLFDAAERAFGGVDILVNNAGILKLAPLADTDDASFEQQIAINLTGVFRAMREAAGRLRDGGRIINFSSSVVGAYGPTYGVYAASKAAVEAMTHVASKELGRRGITVNAVAPGPVETELFMTGKSDELVQRIVGTIPLGRLGQPDDIASVVSFLASPQGGWVNGQVLRANGGMI